MHKFVPTRRVEFALAAAALFLVMPSHQPPAFGQNPTSPKVSVDAAASAHSLDIEGSGEQLRVLAAVYAAWSQDPRPKGSNDSPDITAYHFRIAESGANYTVTLWPKKPVIKRIATPQGVRMESESSTFYFTVRRNDFKVMGRAAIM